METKQSVFKTQEKKPFETAMAVADYYGFKPVGTIYDKKSRGKDFVSNNERDLQQNIFIESGALNSEHPMFYTIKVDKSDEKEFCLNVFNTKKSVAEALIMQTSMSILSEYGYNNMFVDINSLGDNKSFSSFVKDLGSYYRKNIDSICPHCKNKVHKNPLKIVDCKNEKCVSLLNDAPKAISYLNDDQIRHFKEIIEYLESIGVQYKINDNLIYDEIENGLPNIIFQIKKIGDAEKEEMILAKGERFDHQLKNSKSRKRIPSVYTSLDLLKIKKVHKTELTGHGIGNKKIYFVHIGHEARLQSLCVIENLRKRHIPIFQSIIEDGLIKQMLDAESINASYTIIMGVKEVKDKFVIVRNMNTHAQESISIEQLPIYLKHVVK